MTTSEDTDNMDDHVPPPTLSQPIIKHTLFGTRYDNPWATWKTPQFNKLFNFIFRTKDESDIPKEEVSDLTRLFYFIFSLIL